MVLPGEPDQKTVVVLGMHRSGTSLTAGILQILGVHIGDRLVPADMTNVKGHFEDSDFASLNNRILKSLGGSWKNPPETISNRNVFSQEIERMTQKNLKLWGWKDPRAVFTIDLYLPYLRNPHFVICSRDPYRIALSLQKRDNMDIVEGIRLTHRYQDKILKLIENNPTLPKIFVSFEDLTSDAVAESRRLAEFLGVGLSGSQIRRTRKLVVARDNIEQEVFKMKLRKSVRRFRRSIAKKFMPWRRPS